MSVFLTGDTHHDFSRFANKNIAKLPVPPSEGDIVIIAGDFGGVWDGSKDDQYWLDWLNDKPFKTCWVDGNHENYDLLKEYPQEDWCGGKVQFIRPNVVHLMRGQVYDIQGVRTFTMGGASSHDIQEGIFEKDDPDLRKKIRNTLFGMFRINHLSWWKEELPSEEEYACALANLDSYNNTVDLVISHCAPTFLQNQLTVNSKYDKLTDFLQMLSRILDFSLWCFGHYHLDGLVDDRYLVLYESIIRLNNEKIGVIDE